MKHGDDFSAVVASLDRMLAKFSELKENLDRPVVPVHSSNDLRAQYPVRKMEIAEIEQMMSKFLGQATQVLHPRFMGHQISHTHPASMMGDLAQNLCNNSTAVHDMGAAGIAIERNLIDWFVGKVGWSPSTAGGVLTHGGSIANLTALLAARGNRIPRAWKEGVKEKVVLIAPETSHYCVTRSASIMGLGSDNLRLVPCREDGTMKVAALGETIERSLAAGEKICAVVATAACTATGAFDSLDQIAEIVKSHGLWFHVDGAHGASALVSKKHARRLRGIEQADSIVWDAHKMLRTPNLCTAVLFRDRRVMETMFAQEAPYLSSERPQEWEARNPFLYTIECTHPALGLKMYPVLCALGDAGLEDYVDYTFELAQKAYRWIQSQSDFEAPIEPQANIVVFRVRGADDARHLALYQKVIASGKFHITFTRFREKNYLRLSLMNADTQLENVKELLTEIRRLF